MSHTLRNSIILALVFLLASGFSYYWLKILKSKELNRYVATKSEKQKECDQLKQLADQYDDFKDSLEVLITMFQEKDKILPSFEDSRVTYEYLNALASKPGSTINFTFRTGGNQEFEDYLTTNYILEGDAIFSNLYNFVWKLENYKRLYNIQSLSFQEIKKIDNPDQEPKSYIKFNVVIKGFSSKEKLNISEEIIDDVVSEPISYNPFWPLVKEYIPPNKDNLLVASDAVLQGITEDRAFITDSKGNLNVMKVGDNVYLGYLTRINKPKNQVEFTLNKGGFIETVVLKLKESK